MSIKFNPDGSHLGLRMPIVGQCRLSVVGANLVLKPYGGNVLTINGKYEVVPSEGISLAPTGNVAFTAYDIYAYMDATSGTMKLEKAANATHSMDPVTGAEIKTGDPTRVIVGKAGAGVAGGNWVNNSDARLLINWFNRKRIVAGGAYSVARNWGNNTWAELDGAARCYFLAWGDEPLQGSLTGIMSGTLTGHVAQAGMGFDTVTAPFIGTSEHLNQVGGSVQANIPIAEITAAEGLHYVTPLSAITGGSGTWNLASRVAIQG